VAEMSLDAERREKARALPDDKPNLLAAVAFQLAVFGRVADAGDWLSGASTAADGSDFLIQYIAAVSGCLDRLDKQLKRRPLH
jgi:hypothetical protein